MDELDEYLVKFQTEEIFQRLKRSRAQAHAEIRSNITLLVNDSVPKNVSSSCIEAIHSATFRNRVAWCLLALLTTQLFILAPLVGLNFIAMGIVALLSIALSGYQLAQNEKVEKDFGAVVFQNIGNWYRPKFTKVIEYYI